MTLFALEKEHKDECNGHAILDFRVLARTELEVHSVLANTTAILPTVKPLRFSESRWTRCGIVSLCG